MFRFGDHPLWLNLALFAASAVVIWLAGTKLSRYADAIAERTGVGKAFIGALLLGGVTSLPEASTTLSAVRMGQYEMAFSNILGANILDLALLFLADAAYRGGPVLAEMGRFSALAALLALLLTAIYLVALLERRRRVVFGFGIDSVIVLALYGGGMYVLYTLR